MKIVELKELCHLPIGTIFSELDSQNHNIEGLYRLSAYNDVLPDTDFFYQYLTPILEDYKDWDNPKPTVDDCCQRWALYDENERFVVYEEKDVVELIKMINNREISE